MDVLGVIAIELGLYDTPLKRGLAQWLIDAQLLGGKAGDAYATQFGIMGGKQLGLWASSVNRIVGPSITASIGLGLLGGSLNLAKIASNSAAELSLYRQQLEQIERSAGRAATATGTAADAVKNLGDLAAATPFSNEEIFRIALQEAGRTQNVAQASANTRLLVDAAAALGIQRGNFERFSRNLPDLRLQTDRPANLRDLKELQRIAPFANSALAPILGVKPEQVEAKVREITGAQLFEALQKLGEKNRDLATKLALQDTRNVPDILSESFRQALAPTGDLLNRAIGPLAQGAFALVTNFQALNQASGGALGFGLIGAAAATGAYGLYNAARAAATFAVNVNLAAARLAAIPTSSALVPVGSPVAPGAAPVAPGPKTGFQGVGAFLQKVAPFLLVEDDPGVNYLFSKGRNSKTQDAKAIQNAVKEGTKEGLREIQAEALGGGRRSSSAASRIEGELAMARFLNGIA